MGSGSSIGNSISLRRNSVTSRRNSNSSRKNDQDSVFYLACKNGDIATVEEMLPNLTFGQVNQVEPNGNTALHAASSCNRPDIVRLLLSGGCSRITRNRAGVTAYQEAATDEIRTLFHRSTSDRFVDENITNSFKLLTSNDADTETKINIPDDWVKGHSSADSAHEAKFIIALANSRNPLHKSVKNQAEKRSTSSFRMLVSQAVASEHQEYPKVSGLLKNFANKMGIGNLITVYTLQTPIYTNLQKEADSLSTLIYFHLSELQDRAFQGESYRGARMTEDDINAYKWAIKREGYVLETRTFQSSSIEISIAQEFIQQQQQQNVKDQHDSRFSVLLTLVFPQKCPTAINLTAKALPLLSEFEDEKEVLILPFTLFSVKEIKNDSQDGQYHITLINVPTPKTSLSDAAECIKS
ncbi:unnamed protein product [Adineta steineri]|uniref:Uncharacterized protein n=1 Tax=Adineta steineri TaxID=433720 RepID=A0A815FWB0_9BILA|nr:unnamed protein product [Adineta steineri]CAF3985346.1 unnamed protein product [Adineta steineri]